MKRLIKSDLGNALGYAGLFLVIMASIASVLWTVGRVTGGN